jgi:hypothetical protein
MNVFNMTKINHLNMIDYGYNVTFILISQNLKYYLIFQNELLKMNTMFTLIYLNYSHKNGNNMENQTIEYIYIYVYVILKKT